MPRINSIYAGILYKNNFIFRDANGFNISDGKTRHSGLESLLTWQANDAIRISTNLSWARHVYDFNRELGRGEVILKGNEIDTAPAWLGALRILWQPDDRRAITFWMPPMPIVTPAMAW